MNILLIDGSKLITNYLDRMLEKQIQHLNIFCADTVEKAKSILSKENIQVLISEIQMPDGNGFDLIEFVNENYPQIKSILISNYNYPQYKERALQLGVINLFNKSNELYLIVTSIKKIAAVNA
jgi:two-component system response regulator YesN